MPKHGLVTINDEPTKTRLYRFCEKKIDQWLRERMKSANGDTLPEDEAEFKVSFTEEDNQVACETEIQIHGCSYRGYDLAFDPQQALMHSLKRLQPH